MEEQEVALVLREPAGGVVAGEVGGAVELDAVLLAAALVGLLHLLRIDRIFGLVVARVAAVDVRGHLSFERRKRRAGERIHVPWLQVAARRRTGRTRDQL